MALFLLWPYVEENQLDYPGGDHDALIHQHEDAGDVRADQDVASQALVDKHCRRNDTKRSDGVGFGFCSLPDVKPEPPHYGGIPCP